MWIVQLLNIFRIFIGHWCMAIWKLANTEG